MIVEVFLKKVFLVKIDLETNFQKMSSIEHQCMEQFYQ